MMDDFMNHKMNDNINYIYQLNWTELDKIYGVNDVDETDELNWSYRVYKLGEGYLAGQSRQIISYLAGQSRQIISYLAG